MVSTKFLPADAYTHEVRSTMPRPAAQHLMLARQLGGAVDA